MSEQCFDCWALPPAASPSSEPAPMELGHGRMAQRLRPDPVFTGGLLDSLRGERDTLLDRPAADVAEALGRVGERFLESGDPLREAALEWIPAFASLSRPMAERVLDGMARDWTPSRLAELVGREFGWPSSLDGFVSTTDDGLEMSVGADLSVVIGAGTVPGVAATALVRSLLVKSPVLVKPGLGDVVLPVLWARGLAETAPGLAAAVAVVYWPGGDEEVESVALDAARCVVAYGSDSTLRQIRDRVAPKTRFVGYGHRIGLGIIAREIVQSAKVEEVARDAARAVAMFDQRGCVSPQVLFVESAPGAAEVGRFVDALAEELEELEIGLPRGPATPGEASARRQVMGSYELLAATPGSGIDIREADSGAWAVVVDPRETVTPSCLGRTVIVKPVERMEALDSYLEPLSPFLQTVALEASPDRRAEIGAWLVGRGATRITTFAEAPWPPPWWMHDGAHPLRVLIASAVLERR